MQQLEFHEAANIFPMDEEHLDDLAKDIKEHGQYVPIELINGKILDGRRRYLACQKAGVTPKLRDVEVADPVAYVLSINLHRRHLSVSQLSMVGARAREIYDRQAKDRQRLSEGRGKKGQENFPDLNSDGGQARDKAGKAVGVSGKTLDFATGVLEKGTPKLIQAVDADHMAVSTAYKVTGLPEDAQDELADRAKESFDRRGGPRLRPAEKKEKIKPEPEPEPGEIKLKGVGIFKANEAINCLMRIPKNDALRKRGFQLVTDWIKHNS